MPLSDEIKKQQQAIAQYKNAIAIDKLKKRKAETRRKIILGGLVVKAGLDQLVNDELYLALERLSEEISGA